MYNQRGHDITNINIYNDVNSFEYYCDNLDQ
jgi:hypothetical protein